MLIIRLMKYILIILVFLAAFFPIYINVSAFAVQTKDSPDNLPHAESDTIKDTLMSRIVRHNGVFYIRDSYWKDYERVLSADMDGDKKDELIIRFRSLEAKYMCPAAITVIYGLNKDNKEIVKTIVGGETPKEMELSDVDKDGIKDLIIYDHCGNHYTLIKIYSYKDNDYKCLFENGTACYMYEVNTKLDPTRITIGRENWEKEMWCYAVSDKDSLLEIWEWDGEKFIYLPSLSTSPLLTEEEALEITWQSMKRGMDSRKTEVSGTEDQIDYEEAEDASKWWVAGRRAIELSNKEDLDE